MFGYDLPKVFCAWLGNHFEQFLRQAAQVAKIDDLRAKVPIWSESKLDLVTNRIKMVSKVVNFDQIRVATVRNGLTWLPKCGRFKPNGSESKLELSDLKC